MPWCCRGAAKACQRCAALARLPQFDEMWAWEARPTQPEEYWASMPADVRHRLHVS